MSRRIQITRISSGRITAEVRAALRHGLDAERLAEFLANVDWTGFAEAPQKVRDRLGQLEAWASAYAERELSRGKYMARLASFLPRKERTVRLLFAPGDIVISPFGDPALGPGDERPLTGPEFPASQVLV